MSVKYQSRSSEFNSEGTVTTIVYQGSKAYIEVLKNRYAIGEFGDFGRIKNLRIYQETPSLWCLEIRYEDNDSGGSESPDTAYGRKSAQLKGSILSMALENHENYRTNWNYYLAAAPNTTAIPSWWTTATDTLVSAADADKYMWVKSPSECPMDGSGMWRPIKAPQMPGKESYDVSTYSITESARFASSAAAGYMVANKLNMIGRPDNNFGIAGGNWKCDDASVSWTGKYWLATLTWTRSCDDSEWDERLYAQ